MPSRIMLRVFYTCMTCVCFLTVAVSGRICQSMEFRNKVKYLDGLANCTIIAGHLKIVLLENVDESAYEGVSFPELTEISDFLLMFRVQGLKSIGKLFPNLRIIRGNVLYSNFALVIYDLKDLTDIGLNSLQLIKRGGVKVDKCGKLCFVNSVNWPALGTTLDYTNHNLLSEYCGDCPPNCNGFCWNSEHCQILEQKGCHPQCMGCKKEHSDTSCLLCKNMRDGRRCVESCPSNKITNAATGTCQTEEECLTFSATKKWYTFDGDCVRKCPETHQVEAGRCVPCESCWCQPKNQESDDLVFKIHSVADTEKYKGCVRLNGSLAIKIHEKYVADHMVKNLGSIKVVRDFVRVSRSPGLRTLDVFRNLREIQGKDLENGVYALFVYENVNLQTLWNMSGSSLKIKNGTIGFYNNPKLCLKYIEELKSVARLTNVSSDDVSEYSNGDKATCSYAELVVNITERGPTSVTLKWEPYVSSSPVVGYTVFYTIYTGENMTTEENQDACKSCGWYSSFTINNTLSLTDLTPFTEYSYNIKIYISTSRFGHQTRTKTFMTLESNPSILRNVTVTATSSRSIKLSWVPPQYPNGNLSYYLIAYFPEEDDPNLLVDRNFCTSPQRSRHNRWDLSKMLDNGTVIPKNLTCNCDCERPLLGQEFKYDFSHNVALLLSPVNLHEINSTLTKFKSSDFNETKLVQTSNANITSYQVTELDHFKVYVFLVTVCNTKDQCSQIHVASVRTKRYEPADDVHNVVAEVDGTNVYVSWIDPPSPNSMILAYNIEYKANVENAKFNPKCITKSEFERTSKLVLPNFVSGVYSLRVTAISLAGPGRPSPLIEFSINQRGVSAAVIIILVTFFLLILILGFSVSYYWYRRKYWKNIHLIANVNPDYDGLHYTEDEWEMDRADIDILNDLGQGTFGMVYKGLIKSKNLSCAIKTVNDGANINDRMEFLNEASVMKTFSEAHHVVKLLGVVSRGPIPLVVMELMERGDLKSFLRRTRDSSQNLTCNEIYRMAAEIADGMAYLVAKKFVHRDLAARNCMVSHDRTVKVGDFGMARDVYENDYYRKETKGLLPVRWMAPESLADGVFTSDSDVWSYGIVLWEMATLAEQPYQGLANEQVFQFVINKGKLGRPLNCPDFLYDIMEACWMWRPNDRPLFIDIVDKIEGHIGQDFRLVSFFHSREGEDYRMNNRERPYNPPAMIIGPDGPFGRFDASEEEVNLRTDRGESDVQVFPSSLHW